LVYIKIYIIKLTLNLIIKSNIDEKKYIKNFMA
jgi:hypothetical protein